MFYGGCGNRTEGVAVEEIEVFQEVKYMFYTGLFKRVIPFVLTFAAGLFLASFFVSIAFPGERWRSGRRMHRFQERHQLRVENEDLREKNRLLRRENE